MSTFLIFSRHYDAASATTYSRILQILRGQGCRVIVWPDLFDQMLQAGFADVYTADRMEPHDDISEASAVLSVGGDGTFLAAAKVVLGSHVPILGINRGHLGFLADVPPDHLHEALADLLAGNYRTSDVPVLNMYADDARLPIGCAINEFAISKCDNSSMITLDTYVDGDYLTTYWADGLIVSTATGSTAYNLSVGGPIVCPTSPCIILTPMAPHNLTIRPLVLPMSSVLTLHVNGRGPNVMVSYDGQTSVRPNGGWFRIGKTAASVKRIQLRSYSFFASIRDKLMWGADMRNASDIPLRPLQDFEQ